VHQSTTFLCAQMCLSVPQRPAHFSNSRATSLLTNMRALCRSARLMASLGRASTLTWRPEHVLTANTRAWKMVLVHSVMRIRSTLHFRAFRSSEVASYALGLQHTEASLRISLSHTRPCCMFLWFSRISSTRKFLTTSCQRGFIPITTSLLHGIL
jgi:hypothetical protein